ncbi:LytR C-terminal domain-containing protein [Nocardia sp. NPDC052566]|uniref:LytR C-terminal domain-containing protein n=1 Tax=Nocardia sp. NPDC052566 TaxID=3364330 RepID=UPI0037CB580B
MSYPNSTSGGPPLRALAMVLIALAIVFGGLGAMSLSSSDSDSNGAGSTSTSGTAAPQVTAPAKTTVAAPPVTGAPSSAAASTPPVTSTTPPVTTTAAPTLPPTTTSAAATVNHSIPVRVLNNSLVVGLAARTASQLNANGWSNTQTGNYPGENVAKTTVYYGNSPGEREAALEIASELGVTAEPRGAGLSDQGSGVIVIVTGN